MNTSPELLEAIDQFDIEAYLDKLGAEQVSGNEQILDCPVCGKNKLCVNIKRKTWHCWVCQEYMFDHFGKKKAIKGAGGLVSLIKLFEECSSREAAQIVLRSSTHRGITGVVLDGVEINNLISDVVPRMADPIPFPDYWTTDVTAILTYTRQRGISDEDVRAFGLFGCTAGRYAHRLIFPVWEHGRFVYFQARAMWAKEQNMSSRYIKTLNPPTVEGKATAADVLFNLDIAKQYQRVAITEGPIDAIHTGPDAVCTFGKKLSPVQILKLKYAGVRAIDLLWDGPGPTEPYGAWPEMIRVGKQLSGIFDDVRLVFLPQGDPGDYSREALTHYRACGRSIDECSQLVTL